MLDSALSFSFSPQKWFRDTVLVLSSRLLYLLSQGRNSSLRPTVFNFNSTSTKKEREKGNRQESRKKEKENILVHSTNHSGAFLLLYLSPSPSRMLMRSWLHICTLCPVQSYPVRVLTQYARIPDREATFSNSHSRSTLLLIFFQSSWKILLYTTITGITGSPSTNLIHNHCRPPRHHQATCSTPPGMA